MSSSKTPAFFKMSKQGAEKLTERSVLPLRAFRYPFLEKPMDRCRRISSFIDWITSDSVPTVVAYGAHDRVQSFKAALRLKAVLEENGVDDQYFECAHSGHGLQNDNAVYKQWMETVKKYMPVA